MFIEEIMYRILQPISDAYEFDRKKAMDMDEDELFLLIKSQIKYIVENKTGVQGTIIFPTPGCPHNVRDGKHCGCSFCDWNEDSISNIAYTTELRKKSSTLYRKLQREYINKILSKRKICFFEEYAIQDCFSDEQITDDEINELFLKEECFENKPILGLVQVRADSVTDNKIIKWKQVVRKGLTLGIGVETGNEWLRNHWLNKGISDIKVINCISIAHRNNCNVCANLLIEIPGLNVKQNIECLIESITKLSKLGCDSIMLSPLVKKKYTIQYYLDTPLLTEDWDKFYFILMVLFEIAHLCDDEKRKIMLSSLNFGDYVNNIRDMDCKSSFQKLLKPICAIGGMKVFDNVIYHYNQFCNDDNFIKYKNLVDAQNGIDKMYDNLLDNARVLQKRVLPDNNDCLIQFQDEILNRTTI